MGPSHSRKGGKGRNPLKPWTDDDFRNPPDESEQSTWTDARRKKFQELREEWVIKNSGAPESDAAGTIENQHVDSCDHSITTENVSTTRPAIDNASNITNSVASLSLTGNSQTVDTAAQSSATAGQGGSTQATSTIASFYRFASIDSDPAVEEQGSGKRVAGDPDSSEVDAYVLRSQRPIGKVGNLDRGKTTRFSANHLALRVEGPDIAYIYPVTVVSEQKPQSMQNAPQRRSVVSTSSQGYPDISSKRRRRIFELLLLALQAALPQAHGRRATNYKTQIAALQHELIVQVNGQSVHAPFIVTIQYFDLTHTTPSNDPYVYQVAISTARQLEVGRLQRTLDHSLRPNEVGFTPQQINGMKAEYLDLFNMLTTQVPTERYIRTTQTSALGMALAGTSKFFLYTPGPQGLNLTHDMRNGLSALFGFYRSARLLNSQPQLQLNINTATSAFYRWEKLQKVMTDKIAGDFQGGSGNINLGTVSVSQWQELERFIKGLKVRAQYNNVDSVYTVTGLAMTEPDVQWDSRQQKKILRDLDWPWTQRAPVARNVSFLTDQRDAQGQRVVDANGIIQKQRPPIQIFNHYTNTLGVQIGRDDFVIRAGGGERVLYFPASLLTVLPGQHYKGQLAITVGAKTPIANRREILSRGKETYSFDPARQADMVNRFGLRLGNQGGLLEVTGEQLGPRNLKYKSTEVSNRSRWNLVNTKCVTPPISTESDRWSVIEFTTGHSSHDGNTRNLNDTKLGQFIKCFDHALADFGLNMPSEVDTSNHYSGHKIDVNGTSPWDVLRYNMRTYPYIKLWVILLPEKRTDWYSQVKIIGDLEFGVSTVCHVKKIYKTEKDLMQLCSNICLKANLKLSRSSVNHTLMQPSRLLTGDTMVVGIDVTHAPGGARKNSPSVAAVVASIDTKFAQWPASIKLNARDELDTKEALEEVQDLKTMMIERLSCYRRYNKDKYPQRIIIYRDGLSEGQFQMAKTKELGRMIAAIDQLYGPDNHPEIMLLCAVKRHHTRFLPNTDPPTGQTTGPNATHQGDHNPAVSTVFYDTVTYGDGNDFFLVSQNAMRGATVRPAHYVVLVNTCANVSIREVANMTLDLCFLFGRATTTVGLATPAYYADLACGRAAKYLAPHTRPDPRRPHEPFDYTTVPNIRLAPVSNPNNSENFGDSMFYL